MERDTADRLLAMKKKIESTKKEIHQTEGRLEELKDRMKKEFNVASTEDLEKEINILKKLILTQEKSITEGMKELESKYEWD